MTAGRHRKRRAALAAGTLALLLVPRLAFGDDARLATARRHHQALDFEKCIATLAEPAPTESTDLDRGDAAVLEGACWFELGRRVEATERFKRGLRLNARVLLPPYASPKMVAAFAAARAEVATEDAPAPSSNTNSEPSGHEPSANHTAEPLRPPSVAPAPAAPRTEQPRHALPLASLVLGGAALTAAAVGTYGYARGRGLESDANDARFESDAYSLGDRARGSMVIANVGFVGAVVLAAAAVVVWLRAEP